jgi:DNA-binding CsgD family transcriptional regulator/tetratricopeptide (TPR) repeat protein
MSSGRIRSSTILGTDASSGYDEAHAALAAGKLDHCLELCERARATRRNASSVRFLALQAECLRRRYRPAEAIRVLQDSALIGMTPAHEELQSILGRSLLEIGDMRSAEEILQRALRQARSRVGRELNALALALVYYNQCRFTDAEPLLALVREGATHRYVRRLEFEGWIATHNEDFDSADHHFDEALALLARLPRDVRLELNLLCVACEHAVERLDLDRWRLLSRRAEALGPLPVALWFERFSLGWTRSIASEIEGQPEVALRHARDLIDRECPPAVRLLALCRRAAVLIRYDERIGYRDLVDSIDRRYQRLALRSGGTALHPQEMRVFDAVAETFALAGDHARALAVLDDQTSCTSPNTPWRHNPIDAAQRSYVRALIADTRGESLNARRHYVEALRTFRRVGYHRRGIIVAQRLIEMNRDADLVSYLRSHVRPLGRESWVRSRFVRSLTTQDNVTDARLSRAQREVLELLLSGTQTQDIALRRGRSQKTVRNTISSLLKVFGVESRHALVCECMRRRLHADAR